MLPNFDIKSNDVRVIERALADIRDAAQREIDILYKEINRMKARLDTLEGG